MTKTQERNRAKNSRSRNDLVLGLSYTDFQIIDEYRKFHQKSVIYNRNQMDNFNLKIMVIEIKNSVDKFKNMLNTSEEKVGDLKDRSVENIQIKVWNGKKNV